MIKHRIPCKEIGTHIARNKYHTTRLYLYNYPSYLHVYKLQCWNEYTGTWYELKTSWDYDNLKQWCFNHSYPISDTPLINVKIERR